MLRFAQALLIAVAFTGCNSTTDGGHDHDHDHDHDHENEFVTTLELTFTDSAGGSFTATWSDPEGDGSPEIDDLTLPAGETYTVDWIVRPLCGDQATSNSTNDLTFTTAP